MKYTARVYSCKSECQTYSDEPINLILGDVASVMAQPISHN